MTRSGPGVSKTVRCAIYTRVSTDAGLEQAFNSLDAQREASEAYIKSQAHEGWKLIQTAYDDGGFSGGSLERPALQRLLDDVRNHLVDTIVVYKVDRLTRSLTDFARLVELFDAHGVSFASVTQAFNTTTSMGRLTLNMLLSFAQFEREVTGERIRDKVAASKKKGIWMGGGVPLGYRALNRKLLIVPEEADTVRQIFACYLEQGSTARLLEELRRRGIRTRQRTLPDGRTVGGIFFTPGPVSHLLRNRIYLGEIVHKGQYYPGEHAAILEQSLFEAVQTRLAGNRNSHHARREASNALLLGRLFDDAGNVMSPTHCRKGGIRYRYYTSRAFIEGRKQEAGSIPRVAAGDIESKIIAVLRDAGVMAGPAAQDEQAGANGETSPKQKTAATANPEKDLPEAARTDAPSSSRDEARALIRPAIARVVIEKGQLAITLTDAAAKVMRQTALSVPWSPRPKKPRRDLILPINGPITNPRPMHAERRARHLRAIALGRKWLDELVSGRVTDAAAIAARENRSTRSVHMMLSLAFVAPDIVEAAAAGRLPRGIGITRLIDLPPVWAKQKETLGLPAKF